MKKRLESAYKTRVQVLAGKDPTLISAVDSSVYPTLPYPTLP